MTDPWRRFAGDERGLTLAELLMALAIFALFIIVVDTLFVGANRSAKKGELAAEVQQNARIAVERLTREVRESDPGQIVIGGSAGQMAVVFKSARLASDNSVFCLYVRSTSDPSYIYNPTCFLVGSLAGPPYATPPTAPLGTYTPIWQRYIGYYVASASSGSGLELRRVTGTLSAPGASLPSPTSLSGGDVIASLVETFDVALATSTVTATLKAKGAQIVQGSAVPAQEVLLPGQVLMRN